MRLFPHTLSLFNPPISSLDDIQRFWQSCFRRWTAIWSICYKKPILPLQSRVVWSWWRRCWWFSKRLNDAWFPYLSSLYNSQKCYNVYLLVKFHYCFPPLIMMFWKEDSPWFPMLLVTPNSLSASFGQDSLAEILKTKSEIYYSLYCSLFTIHFYCSWHYSLQIFTYLKGGCPLSLTQSFFRNLL